MEWSLPFKVAASAGGGVAAFFITLLVLWKIDPVASANVVRQASDAEVNVRDLHHKIDLLQPDWIQLDRVSGSLNNVAQHAGKYAADMDAIGTSGLNTGHQIDQSEYAGFAHVMAGEAALQMGDKPTAREEADKSLADLKKALSLIDSVKTQITQGGPDQLYLGKLQNQIDEYFDTARSHYLLSVAYALEGQLAENPAEFNQLAVTEFGKLTKSDVNSLDVDPKAEHYLGVLIQ